MKKTAKQILDEATEFGGKAITRDGLVDLMKQYALQVAAETRKKCARRATVKHISIVAVVDKDSILDVEILTP